MFSLPRLNATFSIVDQATGRASTALSRLWNTAMAAIENQFAVSGSGFVVSDGTNIAVLRTMAAGTGLSVANGNGQLGNPTFSIANTTVAAASYGDSTHVATFTVNAQGQLVAAASTAISFPSAPVSSVFGRTGAVVAATGDYSFSQISGSVAATQLPDPTASTLGGVKSLASASHQFLTAIGTDGSPTQAQPAFSDLSGTCSVSQGGKPANRYTAFSGITPYTQSVSNAAEKMAGYGAAWTVTPSSTGKVRVKMIAVFQVSSSGASIVADLRYGTGTAPSANAAQAGTAGTGQALTLSTSNYGAGVIEFELSGLTLSTAYWFDVGIYASAGNALVAPMSIVIEEF